MKTERKVTCWNCKTLTFPGSCWKCSAPVERPPDLFDDLFEAKEQDSTMKKPDEKGGPA